MRAIAYQTARRFAPYFPKSLVMVARYPREFAFVHGLTNFSGPSPSIIFFTTNKTASKLMTRILRVINRRLLGLTPLNLAGYFWDGTGGSDVFDELNRGAERYFRESGILYAPLRQPLDITYLKHARPIAVLRDPRDQIVSAFEGAAAHRAPLDHARRGRFLEHRAELNQLTLEEYVLKYAPSLAARYRGLISCFPHSSFLPYEELWRDTDHFFFRLAQILNIQLDGMTLNEIKGMAESYFSAQVDGVTTLWQKGVPGDYRSKIAPTVDQQLTAEFSDVLKWMYGS